jgi:hypothetical protein
MGVKGIAPFSFGSSDTQLQCVAVAQAAELGNTCAACDSLDEEVVRDGRTHVHLADGTAEAEERALPCLVGVVRSVGGEWLAAIG